MLNKDTKRRARRGIDHTVVEIIYQETPVHSLEQEHLHKNKINSVLKRVGGNHLILEHPLKVPHVSEVPICSTKTNTCQKKT